MGNDEIHILDVQERFSVNAWHAGVDLDDDLGCVFHCGFGDIHADAKAHVTVFVRRRGLDHGHVHGTNLRRSRFGTWEREMGV